MEDKQKINIRFGSWDLPMTVLRKDEHIYRNAEALMKERYAFYTRNYKGLATERYMIMCMLDIAVRLEHTKERANNTELLEKLAPLADELEKLLDKK
ncbi:MAG: cell division protein ZapA [Bacteroidaceae bacterium]|nr:cell division protein ZapA [Bacteroidaceae bacterium]